MPLLGNLLQPVPGPNPCGENLRYAPLYDKIKEARREEDDAPQGDWQREIKRADYPLVIKLASDLLATKSKDLQIAAWLTEALLNREKFTGLKEGLDLLRALVENFWDTVYPELEDGDAELRATPLDWAGSCLGEAVRRVPLTEKKVPLTKTGFNWFDYQQCRAVGYDADAAGSEAKRTAREAAVAEGKLTPEAFDEALGITKKAFYEQLAQEIGASLQSLQALDEVCSQKFGPVAPGFSKLRTALEEVRQTIAILLKKKQEQEPETAPVQEVTTEPEAPAEAEVEHEPAGALEAAQAVARAPKERLLSVEPADREDALRRVVVVARYLRREDASSPVPYLMLRGWRWGELRANGSQLDSAQLEAPSTEVRQQLKRLSLDGQWQEVLETAETAMSAPCGRGWLDLQRYVVRACEALGSSYDFVANAVRSELRTLLADFPGLPELTLTDDTPTANAETQAWLREQVNPPPPVTPEVVTPIHRVEEESRNVSEMPPPSAYEVAMQAVRAGRTEEAIEILTREAGQERSGRARFQRRIELAGLCLASGHEAIAYPILQELADEIERRKLDEWEAPDVIAHPLTLLFHCLNKLDNNSDEKQRVYARICRLDPVQALACSK